MNPYQRDILNYLAFQDDPGKVGLAGRVLGFIKPYFWTFASWQ
jgi:hypothetical protein